MPRGVSLLQDPRWNKSTAFTDAEREQLGLRGLLPPRVLSIHEQLLRVRANFDRKGSDLDRYIFLTGLQDRNDTLYYRFVIEHLEEVMPIIYTPTVGEACRTFGHIFRRPRGLYVSIENRGRIREVLRNWPEQEPQVIVVTDGERILGLGDLGAYGMGIPIGKLALYTACAGIPPHKCLPIVLDVGTENADLLGDPMYTGLLQHRARGAEYDEFLEEFVTAVEEVFPGVLLQFEDFATENALGLLERYRNRICTFNDDVQGTAAVTVAALLSACRAADRPLHRQKVVFLGAGSSATGVADLIVAGMMRQGLSQADARGRIWLVDSKGLVVAARSDLAAHKRPYAHDHPGASGLLEAIEALEPTALIGLSTQGGAFTEQVLGSMARINRRPIVFALSNPTSKAECTAESAYRATGGTALFASGSPFGPVTVGEWTLTPSQANNAYIFPGLGLGIVLGRVRRVPEAMFLAAADALAGFVPEQDLARGTLLPPLGRIREVSARIAVEVIRVASGMGLADAELPDDIDGWVAGAMYDPEYTDLTAS